VSKFGDGIQRITVGISIFTSPRPLRPDRILKLRLGVAGGDVDDVASVAATNSIQGDSVNY
jgi:hypothetical protein